MILPFQSQTPALLSLPDNLKIMILHFLSIEDYYCLSLSHKQINLLIKENSSLWASHLFRSFLNPLLRETEFDNPHLFGIKDIYLQAINPKIMTEPRHLVIDHYQLKQLWKIFLQDHLPVAQSEDFVKRIFSKLSIPTPPFPSLKREMHYFPTKTMFQNFLTEVYFEVQACDLRDRNRALVQRVNKPEKFYELLSLLINNYCNILWSYISSIREPSIMLQEYSRLWKDFVMLIIDYNQIFYPLNHSQINVSTQGGLDNPIWRMMLNVWTDKVFSSLSSRLFDAFGFMLAYHRTKQHKFSFDDTALYQKYYSQQNNFFYHIDGENIQCLQKILQDFYQAVSDLSLNEYSVFFWDCAPTYSDTPKGKLDDCIIEDTRIVYNNCDIAKRSSPDAIKNQFEADAGMIELLFGNELHHKVIETQLNFLKDSLSSFFSTNEENGVDLQKVYDILNILSETKSDENPEFSSSLKNTLLDKLPFFQDYIMLGDSLKEALDYQLYQNDRKVKKLLKAGFILYTDELINEHLRGKTNDANFKMEDLLNGEYVKEVPQI